MYPTHEEASAIEKFCLNVTIPILLETPDGARLHATGTLFEIAGRRFIITARHIFDGLPDLKKLAFPENPSKGGLHTFGSFHLARPTEEHFDVAVMELQDDATIKKLVSHWQFLSLDNVALPSNTLSDGLFFLAGYPASLTKNTAGWVHGAFATVYTQRLDSVPIEAEKPVIADLDMFFEYGKDATPITGKHLQTPELPGTSGTSVWEYRHLVTGVWSPESTTRVVGVQSSYIHTKYFRAKNWRAVAEVIKRIDQHLADAIQDQLHEI